MGNNQYYYAVTRIHNDESSLLTDQAVDRMRQAGGFSDCLGILREHGWSADESMQIQEIIDTRREKTWAFLNELIDSPGMLDLFRYEYDFNNLKAALKLQYVKKMPDFGERYISKFGTLPEQLIKDSISAGSFELLPELFGPPAEEANRILLQTGNGQLADVVLDKACLEAMWAEANRLNSDVLKQYVEIKADAANVMTAVRGMNMDKSADFFDIALTELGSLSKPELSSAVSKGIDAVYTYLSSTRYAPCLDVPKGSLSFFQAELESSLIEAIKPQRYSIGGSEPIFAFVIAKENELKVVRLLLSSKINLFSKDFVSGCLRRMYA